MSTDTATPTELADITAVPAAGQKILHEGKEYSTIKEGLAYILFPATAAKVPQTAPRGDNQAQSVFYNPIQQFNRDLSVLAIKAFGEERVENKRAKIERANKARNAKKLGKRKRGKDEPEEKDSSRKAGKLEHNGEANSTKPEANGSADTQEEIDAQLNASDGNAKEVTGAEEGAENKDGNGDRPRNDTVESKPPPFTILDALSATGLRAVRYAHEIPFTTSVTANDLLPEATAAIGMNAKHNGLEDKITAVTGNALTHMYSLAYEPTDPKSRSKPTKKYDVIDLDPYGTAVPFLDAAVQALSDGGLLCVTCTDAAVFASNGYPEKAYSSYGGLPIKGPHSHEGGLRLILHAIATSAARYGLSMEPLLSLSIDFYARVFVRIRKSAANVKFLAGTTMVVYNCDSGCGAYHPQLMARNKVAPNKNGKGTFYKYVFATAPTSPEECEQCGTKPHLAGPMYAGPLHSKSFVERILNSLASVSKETYETTGRIEGMLTTALEETIPPLEVEGDLPPPPRDPSKHDPAAIDHFPFFFIPSALAKVLHCQTPHENALRGALRSLGYRVTRSHTKGGSIKTDAPWDVIWEVMREWVRQKAPVKEGAIRERTPGWTIMQRASKLVGADKSDGETKEGDGTAVKREVMFDEKLGMEKDKKKLVRYQTNPRENWGPMNRAKGH